MSLNPTALTVQAVNSESTSPLLAGPSTSVPVSPMKTTLNKDKDTRPVVGGKGVSGLRALRAIFQSTSRDDENDDTGAVGCSSTKNAVSSTKNAESSTKNVVSSTKNAESLSKKTKAHVSKRHAKVLKPVIQGISKNEIKRIARRAGVSRIGGGVYEEVRLQTQNFLDEFLFKTLVHVDHRQAMTVTPADVVRGFKSTGGTAYGYD